jgi:hypothetical protein
MHRLNKIIDMRRLTKSNYIASKFVVVLREATIVPAVNRKNGYIAT